MSSENDVRIIMVESLRFPEEGSSALGKPGAKVRSKRRSRCTYGRNSVASEKLKHEDTFQWCEQGVGYPCRKGHE